MFLNGYTEAVKAPARSQTGDEILWRGSRFSQVPSCSGEAVEHQVLVGIEQVDQEAAWPSHSEFVRLQDGVCESAVGTENPVCFRANGGCQHMPIIRIFQR
jgi:hypothetical protein